MVTPTRFGQPPLGCFARSEQQEKVSATCHRLSVIEPYSLIDRLARRYKASKMQST